MDKEDSVAAATTNAGDKPKALRFRAKGKGGRGDLDAATVVELLTDDENWDGMGERLAEEEDVRE